MNIKSTAEHLQRLGQPFDIILIKGGVERQLYTNREPNEQLEAMLQEIVDDWEPDGIIIQEKRRNGNNNRKTEKFNVSLNGIEEMPQNNQIQPQTVPSEFKDYLIGELKEKVATLTSENKELKAENKELNKANFELEKENRYKDKEFELDKKGMEIEKSNGLSGVLETVSTNPALATIAATAIGRLMGIEVPAIGAIEAPQSEAEADTLQLKVADNIKKWLVTQPDEVVTEVFNLLNLLATDVSKINDCINYLNEM